MKSANLPRHSATEVPVDDGMPVAATEMHRVPVPQPDASEGAGPAHTGGGENVITRPAVATSRARCIGESSLGPFGDARGATETWPLSELTGVRREHNRQSLRESNKRR